MFLRITLGNHICKGEGSMTGQKLNCNVNGKLISADPMGIFGAGMVLCYSSLLTPEVWTLIPLLINHSLDAGFPQEVGNIGKGRRQFPERDLAKNFQLPKT